MKHKSFEYVSVGVEEAVKHKSLFLVAAVGAIALIAIGCTQPSPSAAPTSAPASATKAPAAAPATIAAPAAKLNWPEKGKTITVTLPWPAGGATDNATRTILGPIEKDLGTQFQIVPKPGAGGQTNYTEFMNAKPDGYTFSFFNFPDIVLHPLDKERQAAYSRKNFQPVAGFAVDDNLLFVANDSPFKTVKDFVDAVKADPTKYTVGSLGVLTAPHIGMVMLGQATGAKFNLVQFSGNADSVAAMLGGKVSALAQGAAGSYQYVKAGQLRPLGVMGDRENIFYPGVRTFEQQGYGKIYMGASMSFMAPAGTPKEIVSAFSAAVKKSWDNPEVQQKFKDLGVMPLYRDTAALEAYWTEQEAALKPIVEIVRGK